MFFPEPTNADNALHLLTFLTLHSVLNIPTLIKSILFVYRKEVYTTSFTVTARFSSILRLACDPSLLIYYQDLSASVQLLTTRKYETFEGIK